MSKFQKKIEDLEAKAADSELIANLSIDQALQARSAADAKRYQAEADTLRKVDDGEQVPHVSRHA